MGGWAGVAQVESQEGLKLVSLQLDLFLVYTYRVESQEGLKHNYEVAIPIISAMRLSLESQEGLKLNRQNHVATIFLHNH